MRLSDGQTPIAIGSAPKGVRCGVWVEDLLVLAAKDGLYVVSVPKNLVNRTTLSKVATYSIASGEGLGCPELTADLTAVLYSKVLGSNQVVRKVTIAEANDSQLLTNAAQPHIVGDELLVMREGRWHSCLWLQCGGNASNLQSLDEYAKDYDVVAGRAVATTVAGNPPETCIVEMLPSKPGSWEQVVCDVGLRHPRLVQVNELCVDSPKDSIRFTRASKSASWARGQGSCKPVPTRQDVDVKSGILCREERKQGATASVYSNKMEVRWSSTSEITTILNASEPIWDSQQPTLFYREGSALRYLDRNKRAKVGVDIVRKEFDKMPLMDTEPGCRLTYDYLAGYLVAAARKGPAEADVGKVEPFAPANQPRRHDKPTFLQNARQSISKMLGTSPP